MHDMLFVGLTAMLNPPNSRLARRIWRRPEVGRHRKWIIRRRRRVVALQSCSVIHLTTWPLIVARHWTVGQSVRLEFTGSCQDAR